MAQFFNDLNIHGAGQIQFKNSAGANAGKIDQNGNNLVITNAVGDVLLGDGSSDVYIGDGTNNVDIIFEQSGAIKGDGSAVTLTLGGANTTLNLENPNFNGNIGMSSKLTFTTANGYILFDYEPSGDTGEYTTEVPLLKVDLNGSESTILARVSEYRGVVLGADDTVWLRAGDTGTVIKANVGLTAEQVVMSAEGGFIAYGFPGNDTTWSNRNEFQFRTDSTTAGTNGLYIGDGGRTQFIDLSRNLKNIGTIDSGAIEASGVVDGAFTALRLANQKTYGSGTGINETVRFAMGISESGAGGLDQREGFVIETYTADESDSSNINTEFKVRDGGTIGTAMKLTGANKNVDFYNHVNLQDGKYLMWGGNAILQHNGTQTYIGDNTSSSAVTITSGKLSVGRAHLFTSNTDRATIQAGSSGTTGHLYFNSYEGSDLHQLTWSGANNGFYPQGASGSFDLGLNGNRWNRVYANYFYGDGSNLTGITATETDTLATVTGRGASTSTSSTFSGGLVASGGLSGFDNNNGISGNNYNITGVNQLSINDPGEGILFGGGSNNVSLYAVDDNADNIMKFNGASKLLVDNDRVLVSSERDLATNSTGTSSTDFVTVYNVNGGNLASHVRLSVTGTTGNVVVSCVADIIVNHSQDIFISSMSGNYTQLDIKVTSNNNEDFAIECKRVDSQTSQATLRYSLIALSQDTTITQPNSHSYSGTTFTHRTKPGSYQSATDGADHGYFNHMRVGGYIYHDGDTNTYIKYDADRVRIVNGGSTYLDTNSGTAVLHTSTSFGGDVSGTYNNIVIADDSHNHVISNVDGLQSALDNKTDFNSIRSLGVPAFTAGSNPNITTAQLIGEIETDGGFDSYSSVFKTSWSYAGNYNLSDAGRFTETAGTSWITWTDNSSDSTRGNITALAICPTTGGSSGKVFIYNDQGSGYSPGWREVWTSTSDGSGSGLDADKLDGNHASAFALSSHNHSADEITSGTFNNSRISSGNVTQHEGDIDHDALTNFVANEHIDWSAENAGTIHSSNISFPSDNNTFRTIKVDTNNDGTANATLGASEQLKLIGGTAVTLSESAGVVTINGTAETYTAHENISAASSVDNSGNTFIQDITLDSNGHITFIASAGVSIPTHDNLTGYVANEHIDWTVDASTDIHANNIPDLSGTYLTGLNFSALGNKGSGTGDYSTTGYLEAGRGSGGVALTHNDGYGNANVTFNHVDGTPEQAGSSGRIVVTTDSTTAKMTFELKSNVSNGTAVNTPSVMELSTSGVYVVGVLNLGDSADTTLSRHSSGNVSIEGNKIWHAGGLAFGYSESGKNYPVELDGSNNAYVNVPWTDNNTTYTSSDFNHDDLTGFVANEHIDWTVDQGGTNIHNGNISTSHITGQFTAGNGISFSNSLPVQISQDINYISYSGSNNFIDNASDQTGSEVPTGGTIIYKDTSNSEIVTKALVSDLPFAAESHSHTNYITSNANDNVTGHTEWQDNYHVRLGNSADMRLYHTNGNSYIDNNTGNLYIRANVASDVGGNIHLRPHDNENGIIIKHDAEVELYHNNALKMETTSSGITVTGNVVASGGNVGNLNTSSDIGQQMEYGSTSAATLRCDADRWRVYMGGGGQSREALTVLETGNVGIGDSTPSYKLDVNGTIRATSDIIAFSDERVKENIKTIDNSLEKVNKLRGVEFNKIGEDKKSIGVIAQEIEKILPEVVQTDEDGMKSVAYGNVVGVLIEAIKELNKEVKELKTKLNNGNDL